MRFHLERPSRSAVTFPYTIVAWYLPTSVGRKVPAAARTVPRRPSNCRPAACRPRPFAPDNVGRRSHSPAHPPPDLRNSRRKMPPLWPAEWRPKYYRNKNVRENKRSMSKIRHFLPSHLRIIPQMDRVGPQNGFILFPLFQTTFQQLRRPEKNKADEKGKNATGEKHMKEKIEKSPIKQSIDRIYFAPGCARKKIWSSDEINRLGSELSNRNGIRNVVMDTGKGKYGLTTVHC